MKRTGSSFKKAAKAQQTQLEEHFFRLVEDGDAVAVADFLRDHSGAHSWRRNTGGDDDDTVSRIETPLHRAAQRGRLEVAKALVMAGADVDVTDDAGRTPLMLAAGANMPDVMEYLLSERADINKTGEGGATALSWAAINGAEECARLLLDAGADVNAKGLGGEPPLFSALGMEDEQGARGMVRLLLERGADAELRNERGFTAEDEAFDRNRPGLAAYIGICAREIADDNAEQLRVAIERDTEIIKGGTTVPIAVRRPLQFRKS